MTVQPSLIDSRQDLAAQVQAQLLGALATARSQLGLSKRELAERVGRSRMTVQRAEAEGAGATLSAFCELALALGLTPGWFPTKGRTTPTWRRSHRRISSTRAITTTEQSMTCSGTTVSARPRWLTPGKR